MTISSADFEYIRKLMHQHTALVLAEDKAYLVESRLTPLLKEMGVHTLHQLVRRLKTEPFSSIHQQVLEAMVTTETFFFRDSEPFKMLQNFILPDLLQQRRSERRLCLWCAGCSSGQEPYSIVMLIQEHFPELSTWDLTFIASDISGDILARAQAGLYTQHEVSRGLSPALLQKYFQPQGKTWRINHNLRQKIDYRQFNLANAWPTLPTMDIIFMRNVLIYFDVPTKQHILARVRQVLRPDGYLLLGGGETTIHLDTAFKPTQFNKSICYRLRS
ncbi:MAG: protein-glutamate O-methyltransferase CheR [Leptolyngbyaceae cyanobacterium MO_188.B28]|nr:protein-glutamate O-methyltransferase CheR [Leptolyngbyaceae cyanobacterium MO_188.B28]